jgi:predicted ATPase
VDWQAIRSEAYLTQHLVLLAESYGKVNQAEEGLYTLAKAQAQIEKTNERFYEAELYRLKGTLTLQKGARDWGLEAGPSFQASSLKSPER